MAQNTKARVLIGKVQPLAFHVLRRFKGQGRWQVRAAAAWAKADNPDNVLVRFTTDNKFVEVRKVDIVKDGQDVAQRRADERNAGFVGDDGPAGGI